MSFYLRTVFHRRAYLGTETKAVPDANYDWGHEDCDCPDCGAKEEGR